MGEERVRRCPEPIRENMLKVRSSGPVDTKGKLPNIMGADDGPTAVRG